MDSSGLARMRDSLLHILTEDDRDTRYAGPAGSSNAGPLNGRDDTAAMAQESGAIMTTHATGTFDTTGWDESTVSESDGGGKLIRISSTDTLMAIVKGKRRWSISCSTVPMAQAATSAWNR